MLVVAVSLSALFFAALMMELAMIASVDFRYGARVGGPKYYAVNLILRLFLYHFLHTMSS